MGWSERQYSATEGGFTLLEVLVAGMLFVLVAALALDTLRISDTAVGISATHAAARNALSATVTQMREDAREAVAIEARSTSCGAALEFIERDAARIEVRTYADRAGTIVRLLSSGTIDPCGQAAPAQILLSGASGWRAAAIPASSLPAHSDPISGVPDDGFLATRPIADVAVDTLVRDANGVAIRGGNGIVEVQLAADPVTAVVDLLPGQRASGVTEVLAYACGGRCALNASFPEARGRALVGCTPSTLFANTPQYVVPASFRSVSGANGVTQTVVTSYLVTGAYAFAFGGPDAFVAQRSWPVRVWPPNSATIADPYPVVYGEDALAALSVARIAADVGATTTFGAQLAACAAMNQESVYAN
jgi:type II secretory pathway pseudopilin PulG